MGMLMGNMSRKFVATQLVSLLEDMTVAERITYVTTMLNKLDDPTFSIVADHASVVPSALTEEIESHYNRLTHRIVK